MENTSIESLLDQITKQQAALQDTQGKIVQLVAAVVAQKKETPKPIVKTKPSVEDAVYHYVTEKGQSGLAEIADRLKEHRSLIHYHAKKLAGLGKIVLAYKNDEKGRITLQAYDPARVALE